MQVFISKYILRICRSLLILNALVFICGLLMWNTGSTSFHASEVVGNIFEIGYVFQFLASIIALIAIIVIKSISKKQMIWLIMIIIITLIEAVPVIDHMRYQF